MPTSTFNAASDIFGLEAFTNNAVKVKGGDENRSGQSQSGKNTYGDTIVVDRYGETAAPSRDYDVVADVDDSSFADFGGSLIENADGFVLPLAVGGMSINTQNGSAPTISVRGQLVQAGAVRLRKYSPVAFKLSARHRAQDFVCTKSGSVYTPVMEIKKGENAASDIEDYGLERVSGDVMPIEFTTAMPKGVLASYDLHGGIATVNYTMNWYADAEPSIALSAAAVAAGLTMSAPVNKSDPENGYTQYTWSVSVPMIGEEAA